MPKRSATTAASDEGQAFTKAQAGCLKRRVSEDVEGMGEFEDAWEDEIESDEEVVNGEDDEERDADHMDVDGDVLPAIEESEEQNDGPTQIPFIPGRHVLGKDELLEPDESVYIMRHSMAVNWPCLSFDVLRDSLGDERQRYPATAYIVAGTQADVPKNNQVLVLKMSSMYRTQRHDDSDSEDEGDDDDDLDEDPIVDSRVIPHIGGVNRIRAQPMPSGATLLSLEIPYYTATWSETGNVHIWNVRHLIEALDVPGYIPDKSKTNKPAFTITSHGRNEGFAMDWAASNDSQPSALRLLTGDTRSKIYLTTSNPSGFNALSQPFVSHTSCVEDLQWSPSEPTVFASCSADHSIRIWDVRAKGRKSVVNVENSHPQDVNVISWSKNTQYLLLSGGDEGSVKVWDLRQMKSDPASSSVAAFDWHKAPITSIEWHPTEESIFAASSADNQVTLWDLSVEKDIEQTGGDEDGEHLQDVPPQLLFVHQGQQDVKELHWHPQIPGTVISTALDGFNVFKTISV